MAHTIFGNNYKEAQQMFEQMNFFSHFDASFQESYFFSS